MRKLIIMALFCLLPLAINGQKVKDGFKGFEWGTPRFEMDSLFHLDSIGEDIPYLVYSTNIDSIGGVKLSACNFEFYKNKFAVVAIIVKGYSNWDKLLAALTSVYGKPEQPNRYIKKYNWHSRHTLRVYEYNQFTKTGTLLMFSIQIYKEAEKDKEREAEKAKDDF